MTKHKQHDTISFDVSKDDLELIRKVVNRYRDACNEHGVETDILGTTMDLTACHANGTPLDLEKLLAADEFTLFHDINGIYRHIDRETGCVGDCFLPRCARKDQG